MKFLNFSFLQSQVTQVSHMVLQHVVHVVCLYLARFKIRIHTTNLCLVYSLPAHSGLKKIQMYIIGPMPTVMQMHFNFRARNKHLNNFLPLFELE